MLVTATNVWGAAIKELPPLPSSRLFVSPIPHVPFFGAVFVGESLVFYDNSCPILLEPTPPLTRDLWKKALRETIDPIDLSRALAKDDAHTEKGWHDIFKLNGIASLGGYTHVFIVKSVVGVCTLYRILLCSSHLIEKFTLRQFDPSSHDSLSTIRVLDAWIQEVDNEVLLALAFQPMKEYPGFPIWRLAPTFHYNGKDIVTSYVEREYTLTYQYADKNFQEVHVANTRTDEFPHPFLETPRVFVKFSDRKIVDRVLAGRISHLTLPQALMFRWSIFPCMGPSIGSLGVTYGDLNRLGRKGALSIVTKISETVALKRPKLFSAFWAPLESWDPTRKAFPIQSLPLILDRWVSPNEDAPFLQVSFPGEARPIRGGDTLFYDPANELYYVMLRHPVTGQDLPSWTETVAARYRQAGLFVGECLLARQF